MLYYTNYMIFRTALEEQMGTIRKTITLTERQGDWVKHQIESGEYTNDSEYIRALIRQDQERNTKFLALKQAIQDGLDSGVGDMTLDEIWREAEARHKAKRNG